MNTQKSQPPAARRSIVRGFILPVFALSYALSACAFAQTTLLYESFEGEFPAQNGWSTGDSNSSGTTAYWDDVGSSFGGEGTHGGSWKGYCAGVGYGGTTTSPMYRDSMTAYMSKSINFSGYSSASLSFWYKIPSIESWDKLRVYMDSTIIWERSSAQTSWAQVTLSLAGYVGGSHTLKFEFYSDSSVAYEGAYLDDILVTATPTAQNADLALTTLTVSPSSVVAKAFTACSFNLVNNGPASLSSEGLLVEYYLSNDTIFGDADDVKIGDTGLALSLGLGGSTTISLNSIGLENMVRLWPDTVPAGNYYVFARVSITSPPPSDPNAGNNYARTASTISYNPRADLSVSSLTVSPSTVVVKGFSACSFNIANNGPAPLASDTVRVDYYLSANTVFGDADDVKIGDTGHTLTLASGSSITLNLSANGLAQMVRFWPDSVPAGSYYVFARVSITSPPPSDPNSGNNYARTASTISYNPRADLSLSALTVSPSAVIVKAFSACSFNILNNGPAPLASDTVRVDYYLSANTVFGDADDVKIGDTGLTLSLGVGLSTTIWLNSTGLDNMVRLWPDTVPAGNYYVFARVSITSPPPSDPNAGNNYARTASTISYNPRADLSLSALTVSPSAVVVKAFSACTFSIVNNGPAPLASDAVRVDYYLSANTLFGDADDVKIGDTGHTLTLASGSSITLNLSANGLAQMVRFWADSVPAGSYYVFARVSITSPPPSDPNSGNNYARTDSTISYNPRADLSLSALTVSPATVVVKAFNACSFNIANNGPAPVPSKPLLVEYYLSGNTSFGDADDVRIGYSTHTLALASGASSTINLNASALASMVRQWPDTVPAGNYYVFARARLLTRVPSDPNSGNNYARTDSTIFYNPRADLSVSALVVSPSTVVVKAFSGCSFNIANNGPAPLASDTVRLDYYLSANTVFGDADDVKIGDSSHTLMLPSGASTLINLDSTALMRMVKLWPDTVAAGNYYVFARVSITSPPPRDPNSGNNYARSASTIFYNPKADLSLTALTPSPSTLVVKAFSACSFNIANNGPAPVPSKPLLVEYYLSANTAFGDTEDVKIGYSTHTLVLPSGASSTINLNASALASMVRQWPDTVPAGNYYVFARARLLTTLPSDPNSGNNYARTDTSISYQPVRPDFVVTAASISPTDPKPGAAFTAYVTVKNQGAAGGDAGRLDVWANKPTAASCGDLGDSYSTVGALASGQSKVITIANLTAPSAGNNTLRTFVDSKCQTTESSEDNNQTTLSYTTAQRVLLLLHGMNSGPETWNDFKNDISYFDVTEPVAPVIYGGVVQNGQTPTLDKKGVEYYRIKFGAFDQDPGRTGLEDVRSTSWQGDSGDFSSFSGSNSHAQELKDAIATILSRHAAAKILLVGHSRGGIDARAFLQTTTYTVERNAIVGLLTVGTPHQGSPLGRIYGFLRDNPRTSPPSTDWQLVDALRGSAAFGLYPNKIDVRRPTIQDLATSSPPLSDLSQGVGNLPTSGKYGTLEFSGVRLGLLADPTVVGIGLGEVDVFTGGSVLGLVYPPLTTAASNTICQFSPRSDFIGDGIVPESSQTFSGGGATVTRFSNTGAVLHTEEPKHKSDIRSAIKSLVDWWD